MPDEYYIGEPFINEWNRIRSKVDGASGDGWHNTPSSLSHSAQTGAVKGDQPGAVVRLEITQRINKSGSGESGYAVGRYNANPMYGKTNNNPTTDLGTSDAGKAGTSTVEVWNLAEIPDNTGLVASAIPLTKGQVVEGRVMGLNKTTGQPVYWIERTYLPAPTSRYQVLTPIDDSLTPLWTSCRFQ